MKHEPQLEFICAALTFGHLLSESLIVFNYWWGKSTRAGKQKRNSQIHKELSHQGRFLGPPVTFSSMERASSKFKSFASFHPLSPLVYTNIWNYIKTTGARRPLSFNEAGPNKGANYPLSSANLSFHTSSIHAFWNRVASCENISRLARTYVLCVSAQRTHSRRVQFSIPR